ncbi:MAG TPA: hypothetical protein VMV55_02080 [Methanoregula sp.]|nr:hypothetical protein [Methanoregula sp.]
MAAKKSHYHKAGIPGLPLCLESAVLRREPSRRECYLCGRYTGICPVKGALVYNGNSCNHQEPLNERSSNCCWQDKLYLQHPLMSA